MCCLPQPLTITWAKPRAKSFTDIIKKTIHILASQHVLDLLKTLPLRFWQEKECKEESTSAAHSKNEECHTHAYCQCD